MIAIILSFMVCGALNWGYAYALGFLLIVGIRPLFRCRAIPIRFIQSPAFWLLAAFGLGYCVFGGFSFERVQNMLILPLAAYATGWCALEQSGQHPAAARDLILAIASGFALHAGLNYFVNLGHSRAQLIDFWSGSYQAATGAGCLNTLMLALLIYTLFLESRRGRKIVLLAMTALCLLYMLTLGNRTQLMILLVVSPLGGALLLIERGRRRGDLKRLLFLLFALAFAALCWRFNWLGIAEKIRQTNLALRLMERGSVRQSNFERVTQFFAGLRNLFAHPFGGQSAQYYFHNMWLDIARVAGLVPMLFMLAYNALTAGHALRLVRDRRLDTGVRYVLLCSYLGVLLNFSLEPVMEGMLSFFLAFCMINGIAERLYALPQKPEGALEAGLRTSSL